MPYTITTKDGITINNIPDDVDPNSQALKDRVAKLRAEQGGAPAGDQPQAQPEQQPEWMETQYGFKVRGAVTPDTGKPTVQREDGALWYGPEQGNTGKAGWFQSSGLRAGSGMETTGAGLTGAVVRGAGPYAAAAGTGGAIAGPPGAALGIGATGLAKLVGDPLTEGANALGVFPTRQWTTSEAIQHGLDWLGITPATTPAERITMAASEAGASALGGVGLGRTLQQSARPMVANTGKMLAADPLQQVVGAVTGAAASQGAAEMGADPLTQFGAGLLGGAAGSTLARPKVSPIVQERLALPDLAKAVDDVRPVAAIPEVSPEDLGKLVKQAAKGSPSSKQKLAELSAVNIQAKEAADRLGIELPADVFSDSPQVRAAAGLTRSVAGSGPEAAWRTMVTNAVDKADEVVRQLDASFSEGQVSPGVVSQKVRERLVKTRTEMNEAARKVYDSVDQAVPKNTPVVMDKVETTLLGILDEVGQGGMSAQEKKLMKMVDGSEPITYGRLIREKNLMGQALAGKESPYGNMEAASLKRLYAALAEDQLDNVGRIGGDELRSELRGANLLYAKERALGKRIISAFGEDTDGSIANRMRSAITGSSKGASEDFNKLMKVVPDDLKKETIATALASVTRSARGAERGGFGFSEFAKVYQGLRANAPVYKQVVDILGPESHKIMRDLYEVSRRVTEARANVLTTGKANQAMLGSLMAESLVQKVMDSTVSRGAATTVAAGVGGPIAAGVASQGLNALANGKKDVVAAAGNLFNSDEFKRLAVEAATKPRVSNATVEALSRSARFKEFGKKIGLTDPDQSRKWLLSAIYGSSATQNDKTTPQAQGTMGNTSANEED